MDKKYTYLIIFMSSSDFTWNIQKQNSVIKWMRIHFRHQNYSGRHNFVYFFCQKKIRENEIKIV